MSSSYLLYIHNQLVRFILLPVDTPHARPPRPEEGIGSPGTGAAMWELGTKPGSCARAASALTAEPDSCIYFLLLYYTTLPHVVNSNLVIS